MRFVVQCAVSVKVNQLTGKLMSGTLQEKKLLRRS